MMSSVLSAQSSIFPSSSFLRRGNKHMPGIMTLNYEVVLADAGSGDGNKDNSNSNSNSNNNNKIICDVMKDTTNGVVVDCGSSNNILFLHGALGKGNDFKTFATKLLNQQQQQQQMPTTTSKAYLFDLRGHGKSRLVRPSSQDNNTTTTPNSSSLPMTFDDFVLDIKKTIATISTREVKEKEEIIKKVNNDNDDDNHQHQQQQYHDCCYPHTVVGHSFGGRLALQYAATATNMDDDDDIYYNPNLQRVWLLDTVPGQINKAVEYGLLVLIDLMTNKTNDGDDDNGKKIRYYKDQNELIEELQSKGVDLGIANWLTSSYKGRTSSIEHRGSDDNDGDDDTGFVDSGDEEGDCFDVDLDVVRDILKDFYNQDFYGLIEMALNNNSKLRIDLVKAGQNNGWTNDPQTEKDLASFQNKHPNQFFVHELPNAGHWVHDDDLDGLLNIFSKSQ